MLGLPFDGKSPFQAAVVFVSTKTFLDLKWGTKEPVVYRDSELAMVRLRAFGKFAVRIVNSQVFVNTVVGTMGIYTTDGVESYFKDVIVARLTDVLGENLQSIFDLPKVYDELSMALKSRVAEDFAKYGIELVDLYLGAITPPPDVQKLIDERTGMAAVGDMNAYLKFKAARAMGDAAQQSGGETSGGVGAGLGVGMGAGMGMMLPQMMKEAMSDSGAGGGQAGGGESAAASKPETSDAAAAPSAAGAGAVAAAFCHACPKVRASVPAAVPRSLGELNSGTDRLGIAGPADRSEVVLHAAGSERQPFRLHAVWWRRPVGVGPALSDLPVLRCDVVCRSLWRRQSLPPAPIAIGGRSRSGRSAMDGR
jgi:membrane protease subunit (stomatin/prohibitin family)